MAEDNTNNELDTLRQQILARLDGLEKGKAIVQKMNEEDLLALRDLSAEKTREQIGIILEAKEDKENNNPSLTVDEINNNVLTVDEQHEEVDQNEDWKDRVRKAENQTNYELKHNFQEVTNDNKTDPLTFKDDKGNTHEFSDENHCRVAGEQTAFDQLARTAKKLGKDTINFGEFKEHPEYKTRLYLACLKEGLKTDGNTPSSEEIQNSPEADAILKELGKNETEKNIIEARKKHIELQKINTLCLKDENFANLLDLYNQEKNEENKKNILTELEKNTLYTQLTKAQEAYEESVTHAQEAYIEYGRRKGPEKTKEERKKEVEDYRREHPLHNHSKSSSSQKVDNFILQQLYQTKQTKR